MGLFDITQIALEQALSGAAARQTVLANNVANANTPGFKRSDIDFHGQLAAAMEGGNAGAIESLAFSPQTDTASAVQSDGNNVDIDTEMSHLSQNALDYQSLVEVANARMKMLTTAIGAAQ